MYNYDLKTRPLLTDDSQAATCRCSLCGRMYRMRPFLCLCRSNAFLVDVEKQQSSRWTAAGTAAAQAALLA